MKHNCRGFTLIEVIVVVAILGILAGTAGIAISTIFSTRERECIDDVDSLLSQCRVLALSGAEEPILRLTLEGNSYYGVLETGGGERSRQRLGGEKLDLHYMANGVEHSLSEGDLRLAFDRETGALYELNEVAGNAVSGSCTAIRAGGFSVALTPATGYHKLSP